MDQRRIERAGGRNEGFSMIVLSYQTNGTSVLLFERTGERYVVHGGNPPSRTPCEYMAKTGGRSPLHDY